MSGFETMPRGLTAEVDLDRYNWIKAAEAANPALAAIRQHRVRLSGGPFDDWAWDVNILPDRFIADGGEYRPTLAGDDVYVWFVPDGDP